MIGITAVKVEKRQGKQGMGHTEIWGLSIHYDQEARVMPTISTTDKVLPMIIIPEGEIARSRAPSRPIVS